MDVRMSSKARNSSQCGIGSGSRIGLGLQRGRLLRYGIQERCPVCLERARPLALETFGEDVDVDSGVSYRCDGRLRRRVVGLEAVVEASVIGEGEQRLFRDRVDRAR